VVAEYEQQHENADEHDRGGSSLLHPEGKGVHGATVPGEM
jgi:hypothetical protein